MRQRTATISDLASALAEDGITAHHDVLVLAMDRAGRANIEPVSAAVAADPCQPEVARLRAFARVARRLAA